MLLAQGKKKEAKKEAMKARKGKTTTRKTTTKRFLEKKKNPEMQRMEKGSEIEAKEPPFRMHLRKLCMLAVR